jgi:Domain of unknown function (DUF932)
MLMAHAGSALVTQAELAALPPPVRRGPYHQPVPHGQLVQAMQATALDRGFAVTHEELALGRAGHRLFGVMDLVVREGGDCAGTERGLSIGFRNSTDTSLSITVVAGTRVFVCDNLALSGDLIALHRRNTTRLDLDVALQEGFDRFLTHAQALDAQIAALQGYELTVTQAKVRLFDLFSTKVLPLRLFAQVAENYLRPSEAMTDCQSRTLWGLHNACTRAMKALTPMRAFTANIALGRAFGLTHAVS